MRNQANKQGEEEGENLNGEEEAGDNYLCFGVSLPRHFQRKWPRQKQCIYVFPWTMFP